MASRIFYVSAGNANIIRSHEYRSRNQSNPDEVSLTFSGQVEDFVEGCNAQALMVSFNADGRRIVDGRFTIEHWFKPPAKGLSWYWTELRGAWRLVRRARKFRADLALLDSGTMPAFMMSLFSLSGIPVIPILHTTLWPSGYRRRSAGQRLVQSLDGLFFRFAPRALIAVSPEAARQVDEIASKRRRYAIEQIRAQFRQIFFQSISPPPNDDNSPFGVLYIGRAVRAKGVLDIPEMAAEVERALPGRVRWTVCGAGADLPELRRIVEAKGLAEIVEVRGWTAPSEQPALYSRSHLAIIPTRSTFAEGLAMTAVEAILAGRPIITSAVVPAHELLAPATVLAVTDNPQSYAAAVIDLATDRARYENLRNSCAHLGAPFLDRSLGLASVLRRLTSTHSNTFE